MAVLLALAKQIPFVLENAMTYPHAPWWQYSDESSAIQTPINAAASRSCSTCWRIRCGCYL